MSDTLDALRAAAVARPADRTVRLVLADALDEAGDPARAAFVRAQVELEGLPPGDPRAAALAAECAELFRAHWIDWWKPVCAAVGLPEPFVPRARLGARLRRRLTGDARAAGAPYAAHPAVPSVSVPEPRVVAHFVAGFPELLHFPTDPPHDLNRWAAAVPLNHLRWAGQHAATDDWDALDHPALARLSVLTVDRLPAGAAERAARFAPLAGLWRLRFGPTNPMPDAVRAAVRNPVWGGLRALELLGTADPSAVRALARDCTLGELEELALEVGGVPAQSGLPGVVGAVATALTRLLANVLAEHELPPGPVTLADHSAALAALAGSPLVPRLKRLTVRSADPGGRDRAARALLRLASAPPGGAPHLADDALLALGAALDPARVERLELPAEHVGPRARAALSARFGPRLALT